MSRSASANERSVADPGPVAERALALLRSSETLARVLAAENRSLARNDTAPLGHLLEAKRAAGRAFEAALRAFDDAGAATDAIDPDVLGDLRAAGQRLVALAEENERRLSVAMIAQRRLLDAVADAARTLIAEPGTYGRNGAPARPRRAVAAPPSFTLNRAL